MRHHVLRHLRHYALKTPLCLYTETPLRLYTQVYGDQCRRVCGGGFFDDWRARWQSQGAAGDVCVCWVCVCVCVRACMRAEMYVCMYAGMHVSR